MYYVGLTPEAHPKLRITMQRMCRGEKADGSRSVPRDRESAPRKSTPAKHEGLMDSFVFLYLMASRPSGIESGSKSARQVVSKALWQ